MFFKIKKLYVRGFYEKIDLKELENKYKGGATILDVRSPQEYNEFHLNGSINIPLYEIPRQIEIKIPDKSSDIILYCQYGGRSKKAAEILKQKGYKNIYELLGRVR